MTEGPIWSNLSLLLKLTIVCSVVLLLWIFVVYNRSIWVLGIMGFLLFAEIATVATILAKSFSNFHGAF